MNKLIINLNDYKSINRANIEINKLNVVSGVNGSGKSTLSRIFYSFLKGNSTKRRDYLFERMVFEFNEIIDLLNEDFVDYDFPEAFKVTDTEDVILEKYGALYNITERHEKLCKTKEEELDKKLSEEFESHIKQLESEGLINIDEIEFTDDDVTSKLLDVAELVPDWSERFMPVLEKIFDLDHQKSYYQTTITVHGMCILFAQSLKILLDEDSFEVSRECVQSLLIKEEHGLIGKKTLGFEMMLSDNSKTNAYEYFFNNGFIDNVYYFDNVSMFDLFNILNLNSKRKMIINNTNILSHTKELLDELSENKDNGKYEELYEIKDILEKIKSIIGGSYSNMIFPIFHTNKIDNSAFSEHFPREKRVVTTTTDTPSGIKQIGIIQLLLLNNKLHEGDYLIIDEPEVNLHPEWQFKFAEILVLLAKELDITIYINSHSPLFIESMDAFCEFYDMQDDINYYLTEPSEDEGKYNFVKINSDEIFKVYDNLGNAYDLIDQLRLKKRLGE